MTTAQIESLRESLARGDMDVEESLRTILQALDAANQLLARHDVGGAAACLDYAANTSQYLDQQIHGWLREFQARRVA